MAFPCSNSTHSRAHLRPATVARRCVGGLIALAGACLLTRDLIGLVFGA